MGDFQHVKSVNEVTQFIAGRSAKHPLFDIIDFSKVEICLPDQIKVNTALYTILIKSECDSALLYGREKYDFEEGVLSFFAPNQIITLAPNIISEPTEHSGWGIYFHPDFIRKTNLSRKIDQYTFFGYAINESLHISQKEQETILNCILNIQSELDNNLDKQSESLIISNLDLFLNYCTRFFERQFITRSKFNSDLLSRFESILNKYFATQKTKQLGLPSVNYCAVEMNLSPNYLSDLLKKETGLNTQQHIHGKLIDEAKTMLLNNRNNSISNIAYDLGFENPSYFTRLFKKNTGLTPTKYIQLN